jgi:hypothetical protein
MKLSQLVGYLNLLESNELAPDYHAAIRRFQEIAHVVENHSVQISNHTHNLLLKIDNIKKELSDTSDVLENLKKDIRQQISVLEADQYQNSQRLYEQEMCYETNEYILNRKLNANDKDKILITACLYRYTDWRLPGLIIRPGREKFIEDLVPLDPLYLVDQHQDLLTPSMNGFTPEYKRR